MGTAKGNPANGFTLSASAADDQGLTAELITGPNFGCAQFERNAIEALARDVSIGQRIASAVESLSEKQCRDVLANISRIVATDCGKAAQGMAALSDDYQRDDFCGVVQDVERALSDAGLPVE